MKKLILALVILGLFANIALAVPPTMITNPDGSKVVRVANSSIKTDTGQRIVQVTGTSWVYNSSCTVGTINMYAVNQGDYIEVFDYTVPHKYWLELEIGVATAESSNSVNLNGAYFANGIYIQASNTTGTLTTITYDY